MDYEKMARADLIGELKLDDEQFKDTFDQVEVGIAHVDLDGQFIKVNRHFCDITGYSKQEILKSTYHNITYPDDIYMQYQIRKKVLDGENSSYKTEKRYIKKDDSIIWVSLTVALIRESDEEPHYFISIIDDIDDHKNTEVESEIGKGSTSSILLSVSTEVDCAEESLEQEQK